MINPCNISYSIYLFLQREVNQKRWKCSWISPVSLFTFARSSKLGLDWKTIALTDYTMVTKGWMHYEITCCDDYLLLQNSVLFATRLTTPMIVTSSCWLVSSQVWQSDSWPFSLHFSMFSRATLITSWRASESTCRSYLSCSWRHAVSQPRVGSPTPPHRGRWTKLYPGWSMRRVPPMQAW